VAFGYIGVVHWAEMIRPQSLSAPNVR